LPSAVTVHNILAQAVALTAMIQCANTGRWYADPLDGICDDGEWISWDWINEYIDDVPVAAEVELPKQRAKPLSPTLTRLIADARTYHARHGKPSRILGELGERFVAEQFGMVRHKRRCVEGSDGKIGNELVEVKTITPGKKNQGICVKRTGNFSLLAVVRIGENYNFEARIIRRSALQKNTERILRLSWMTAISIGCDDYLSEYD
jgi:hypothetical protein